MRKFISVLLILFIISFFIIPISYSNSESYIWTQDLTTSRSGNFCIK